METRTHDFRALLGPLAFAFACVLIALLLWRVFGGGVPLEPKGYRFTVPMPQALNLQPGADVRIAGINVGEVVSVNRAGSRARVTLELEAAYAPISSNARVVLRHKSLLGEAYIGLAPGSRTAPPLPEGGMLAASQVQAQQRIDDYLSAFDPTTRRDMQRFLRGFARGLTERGPALNGAVGWANPMTENLARLTGELDRQRADLRELIDSGGVVLTSLGRRSGALRGAIVEGGRFFAVNAEHSRDLTRTIEALPRFLGELEATARMAEAASGDLERAAVSLEPVAPLVAPAIRETGALAPHLSTLFERLPRTEASAARGLPALTRILESARPAVRQLYPTARQLIPLVELAALNVDSITGPVANFAAVNNRTAPYGPNGEQGHFQRATTMFWNDSFAGYEKPPPSNRQNAYPKPGSLTDIARGGLKAWTCDHLNNPMPIPPFPPGAGAPPCLVQGPWEFRGRSAYFPRLLEAPP